MKTKYYFSCKGSCSSTEPIFSTYANSLDEAIKYFSELKRLPINQFLQLYEVLKDERR